MQQIRVRAVGEGLLPFAADDGATLVVNGRRYVGRTKKFEIIPEGELVPDSAHYRRAIARGALELVADAAPAKPKGSKE